MSDRNLRMESRSQVAELSALGAKKMKRLRLKKRFEPEAKTTFTRDDNLAIGDVVRVTRKHLGLNQTELAPQLGIDQSALSRVESGLQTLTLPQWIEFCRLTGIPMDSCRTGVIETGRPESAYRLPKSYAAYRELRVRFLLPVLTFAQASVGKRGWESWLESVKLDPDFFVNLDAGISFQFLADVLELVLSKTGMKPTASEMGRIWAKSGDAFAHGSLAPIYDSVCEEPFGVVEAWIRHQEQYQSGYDISGERERHGGLTVTLTPTSLFREHLGVLLRQISPELVSALSHSDAAYFAGLSAYGGKTALKVETLESVFSGAKKTVIRLTER